MERSPSRSSTGFQSRRSYPSLNQLSLTPLTARYPIDGDDDNAFDEQSRGNYSARSESPDRPYSAGDHTRRTSSYLSSYSVPGTPTVLSQSRSGSRTRHGFNNDQSGRSSRMSRRQSRDGSGRRTPRSHHRHSTGGSTVGRPDQEWMLRTGIALASSTREEKGQSWLEKRESSTSLASETDTATRPRSRKGTATAASRSQSGRSTPSSHYSTRRGSGSRPRSHAPSRRGSKPDLSMTTTDHNMTPHTHTGVATPVSEARHDFPDAVDKRIRAELMQGGRYADQPDLDEYASSASDSDSSFDYSSADDDMDEKEMQRLTRERGFGLGSWLDRMVEWTVFGIDEPPSAVDVNLPSHSATHSHANTQSDDDRRQFPDQWGNSRGPMRGANPDADVVSLSDTDTDDSFAMDVEKAGEDAGGWEDARWLLHVIKQALL